MRPERHAVFWLVSLAAFLLLVALLRDALLPFALGAVMAYFLNPVADALQRVGLGRTLASILIIGLVAVTIAAAFFFLLPLAVAQVRQLAQSLPSDLDRIRMWLEALAQQHLGHSFPGFKSGLERAVGELSQGSSSILGTAAQALWSRGLALFNLVTLVLVTPVVAFYLLRDWPTMLAKLGCWLPREHEQTIRSLATDIDAAVGAFVRGQGTICLVLGTLYAAALTAVGLRYALAIGLLTGLLSFIPMVGWSLGLVVALVVALTQSWPDVMLPLYVAGIYGAAMALDAGILSPLIVGQRVGLHPVWLMLALFVFSALFGLLGVLVAVPVAAATAVLVRFARDRYLASSLYLGQALPPGGPAAATNSDR
jgi:predicted PurR-regulated permease PerM